MITPHQPFYFRAETNLREAISSFENAYLSRSLSRLFDPINLVFQQGSLAVPSKEEVESVVRTIGRFVIILPLFV